MKGGTGKPGPTWPQSVDEALCFGWIDGIRKRIDDGAYQIRFTPRKAKSTWSVVNVRRVETLIAELPQGRDPLDRQREEGGNPGAAAREAHRELRGRCTLAGLR